MLFMLRIEVSLPPEMSESAKASLREREHARGQELIEKRMLLRIWRVVGRVANLSLWQAPTLESLHDTLSSLPMFPYMKIDVTPLIDHPMTAVVESVHGPVARP